MAGIQRYLYASRMHVVRLLILVLMAGCLTPIGIRVDNTSGLAVISGQVSNLPDQTVVQVGLTADTERLPFPVSGAIVWIVDETAGEVIPCVESPTAPGYYHPEGFTGIPGHSYHVEASFNDRGTYTSATEMLPPLPGSVKAHYEIRSRQYTDFEGIVAEQPFVYVYVDGQLPPVSDPLYLKWNIDEVFLLSPTDFPDPFGRVPPPCFVSQNADPQRIVLMDGSVIHAQSFENVLVAERIVDWTFLEKHAFTIYQSTLTAAAHDYWSKVDVLANQTGSIFDTPPATLKGNIRGTDPEEPTLGFFQATAQVYDRFFIYNSDLPFRVNAITCQYDPNRTEYQPRCLRCSEVRNSSYERPDWF